MASSALLGPQDTGKVMAWIGTALYAAFAVGAPIGTALYVRHGFVAIALATMLIPLVTLALVALMRPIPLPTRARAAFTGVARAVWKPGLALALSGVGFGAITTFIVLFFGQRGWTSAWLAFTALNVAFIAGRAAFGHLPDKLGGAWVAHAEIRRRGRTERRQTMASCIAVLSTGRTGTINASFSAPATGT